MHHFINDCHEQDGICTVVASNQHLRKFVLKLNFFGLHSRVERGEINAAVEATKDMDVRAYLERILEVGSSLQTAQVYLRSRPTRGDVVESFGQTRDESEDPRLEESD